MISTSSPVRRGIALDYSVQLPPPSIICISLVSESLPCSGSSHLPSMVNGTEHTRGDHQGQPYQRAHTLAKPIHPIILVSQFPRSSVSTGICSGGHPCHCSTNEGRSTDLTNSFNLPYPRSSVKRPHGNVFFTIEYTPDSYFPTAPSTLSCW